MPDLYILFAKIQSLPKRRIAEVEDFVDFLTLRASRNPKAAMSRQIQARRRCQCLTTAVPAGTKPLAHSIEGI